MQPGSGIHLPTVLGLLVCEQVIVEKQTDNVSLINCFTIKKVGDFPSGPQRFVVVAFLTDGLGQLDCAVTVQRLDTLEEVARYPVTIHFPGRLREVRFIYRVTTCSFPVAGGYAVCLMVGEEPLAQHRITVI